MPHCAAIAIYQTLPAGVYSTAIATAYNLIGRRLDSIGDYAAAFKQYQLSLALADKVLADHPDGEALLRTLENEADICRALSALHDRAGALAHAARMFERAREALKHGGDAKFVESWMAQADLVRANVHRAFREWEPAQQAAEAALQLATPLANGRSWDPYTKVVRAAQELISTRGN